MPLPSPLSNPEAERRQGVEQTGPGSRNDGSALDFQWRGALHFCHMSQTITFRPTKKLADWIEQTAARIGVSQGKLIRDHLERARQSDNGARKFMRFAGVIRSGPRNLSTRKGFSKK